MDIRAFAKIPALIAGAASAVPTGTGFSRPPVWRAMLFVAALTLIARPILRADCSLTSTGLIPLNDLGPGTYQGVTAGLYPAGSDTPPAAHAAAALAIATDQIKPLNASGTPDPVNGRIVMISIGMSNTTQEFATKGTQNFKLRADADPAKNQQLIIVDGAQGGQDAPAWTNPNAATWTTVNQRLTAAGVTPQQVQVAWLKEALAGPNNYGVFPAHAQALQSDLEIIVRNLKTNFPNIRITYLSPRVRAYTNIPTALNPEPFAYETGFAVKWAVGDQIAGAGNLNFDPANGAVVAPLILWGPYIWADGLTPRSDGFTWLCSDLESDFTHPTASGGVPKVATHLLAFFKTDPTATPWFLKSTATGQPPQVTAGASVSSGPAPLGVNFTASAIDPDGTVAAYQWTFDDGTFSAAQNPAKIFPAPGSYFVHLTVTDNSGNTTLRTLPISVAPAGSSPTPTLTPPPTPTTTPTPPSPTPTLTPTPSPTPATPSPTPTATATVPTSTPTPTPFFVPVYWEGFDAVTAPALPAGWGTSFTPGPANCTPTGTCALGTNWVTSSATSQTAPNAAFHDSPGCITDSSLDTPSIFIPTSPFPSVVYFYQHYDLEAGHDGGVLEISIEGGAFTDINAAGGSTDYSGKISTDFLSPIAGRQAWTGNSGGWFRTTAALPTAAMGHNVVLRFRLATDCDVARTGWYIDSIYIAYFNDFHPTPTPPPLSPTPTAPPTATPIPTPCGVTFSENFDGVTAPALPNGWTTTITGGGDQWETSANTPFSAPNDAVGPAAFNIGNAYLFSPTMVVPAAGGILSFQNLYNLQSGGPPFTTGYDGMVLEMSMNGGAYVDVITAGGSFVAGGYTGTISTGNGSPIGGRMAWTGISAGSMETPAYITSTVNLPATANGQNIQLRWRIATDSIPNFGMGAAGARIDGIVLTPATCATPTPTPTSTPSPTPAAQALQLSTRMLVQTGDNAGIGGFIITGSVPKRVLLRAVGPSLTGFGVPDALADPVLELHGPPGFVTITNDNCGDFLPPISPPFCTPGSLEAAIAATLEPGAYTAIVTGKNNTSGVALVEVYDLNQSVDSKLANISTRAFVSAGDNIVIAGFILGGNNGSDRVVLRGLGPSLTGFGVPNALANPTLELRDENGALLVANNNWQDNPAQAAELTAAGLAPTNPLESGIAIMLPPSLYTALLAGQDNGIGVGVVEVYDRGAP
jgi:PKD repeat protein